MGRTAGTSCGPRCTCPHRNGPTLTFGEWQTIGFDNLRGEGEFDSPRAIAVGPDGTVYVGSYDNKLYAINPDGDPVGSDILVATAGGQTVFTLEVSENGDYEYILFDQIDHPPGQGVAATNGVTRASRSTSARGSVKT